MSRSTRISTHATLTAMLAWAGVAEGCAPGPASDDAAPAADASALRSDTGITDTRCFVPLDTTREAYAERLRGLWLAENVANWTGLLTESERRAPPFFTDEDWGTEQGRYGIEGSAGQTITFNTLDPWGADDDTDIELIYLEAMRRAGSPHLSAQQIREAWLRHIVPDVYVWVSNRAVRHLFEAPTPVLSPSSGLLGANDQSLMIDAQLTTEIFGALAPGRPAHALELAHLPILATASGYAAHAAQVHVVMHALAPVLDPSLSPTAQLRCLVEGAQGTIPEESKTSQVIALVLGLYDARTHRDDWESARDELARVLQAQAPAHGLRYLEWYESSVNFATGLLALLFGEGELARTIRIGTLSGWDSDNGTATMGGLLGLLHGEAWVRAELGREGLIDLSSRYDIARTRVGFERGLYTLEDIAALAWPQVEQSLRETGASLEGDRWRAPLLASEELSVAANPYVRWLAPSATREVHARAETPEVRLVRGTLTEGSSLEGLVDGLELDASGRDRALEVRDEAALARGEPLPRRHLEARGEVVRFELTWPSPIALEGVRFVEGPASLGEVEVEVLEEDTWSRPVLASGSQAPATAFAVRDVHFDTVIAARGVRLTSTGAAGTGTSGTGAARTVSLLELDGLRALSARP